MKRIAYFLAALAALTFQSCNKELGTVESPSGSVTLNLMATESADEVKTYLGQDKKSVLWGTGEYLQLYYNDGSNKFAKSAASSADKYSGKEKAAFDFTLSPASASSYKIGGSKTIGIFIGLLYSGAMPPIMQ